MNSPKNTPKILEQSSETPWTQAPLHRVTAESLPRSGGQAVGVTTAADPLTFRRLSEEDLQLRQQANANLMKVAIPHLEWLSAWLANTPHIAYLVDRDGIVLFSTGNYDNADAFGLTPGYDWSERMIGTSGAGRANAADCSACRCGFMCMGAPLHDPDGQVCGAIDVGTSAEDANEQRLAVMAHIAFVIDRELAHERATATATETIEAQDRLLAEVSHELRTPLNAILGWAHILRKGALDDTSTHALDVIERNAFKQAQFIEDLLDVSRCLAGELRLECSQIVLVPVIKNAVDSLQQTSHAKRQTLNLKLDDSELRVKGDARRLEQVVSNLLSNAIKYTPEGGRIDVTLERIKSQAVITVSDTGIGIRAEFLPHIFDYFRRASGASTGRYEGLGLGLSIVREIVKLHGATIEAQSAGEGRGASFRVLLPLCDGRT